MVRVLFYTTPSAQEIKRLHLRSSTASTSQCRENFLNGGLFYTDKDDKSSVNPGPMVDDKATFLI